MSSKARRIALIGVDSADVALIEHWSEHGLLPAFARLRQEGTWIKLHNRGEFPSMAVWPSIYTGTHPGKTGVYCPVQIAPGKPELELVKPEHCAQPPFWVHLNSLGKHSIVIDVPFTYAMPGLRGLQISNWGSYERYAAPTSVPPETIGRIRRRLGRYPYGAELSRNVPTNVRGFRRARQKMLSGIRLKGKTVRMLMRDEPWDCFMAVFAETHPAGHYFWDFHSSSNKYQTSSEFGSALLDVYRSLDLEIGKIVSALEENTILLIVSGHGMGPNHGGWHLLPEVLKRIGFATSDRTCKNDGGSGLLLRLRESVPRKWRNSVSCFLPNRLRDYLQAHWATSNIDWLNQRAFSLPTDAHGFVRINLKGRDAGGQVKPGREYKEIRDKISRTLKELRDPETGNLIVEELFFTDEVFPGPASESLPDLIVNWRSSKKIEVVESEEIGTISGELPDHRSGNHRSAGFALIYGPGIGKGEESEGHLLDVAPTVLSFYGHAVSDFFDGRPWTHLVA